MKLATLLSALLLAGCATMQPGLQAMERGDLDTAERIFQQALSNGDTMAWNNLGVVYQRRGDREKAIQHYTMAARWGHQLAQQNLVALGAPVPAADLQANRVNQAAAIQQFQQAIQPRPTVNCRTVYHGWVATTSCN
jgi:tetratricopeptide (TPR) repeat protein